MTPVEWVARHAELTGSEPWPSELSEYQVRWLRTAEALIAARVTPEQAASVVLDMEKFWLHGDQASPVRPVGLLRAYR